MGEPCQDVVSTTESKSAGQSVSEFGSGLWRLTKKQREFAEWGLANIEKNAQPIASEDSESMRELIFAVEREYVTELENMLPPVDTSGCSKTEFSAENTDGLTCDVTVYQPEGFEGPLPGLVRIHGGGMAIFNGKENFFELGDRARAKLGMVVCNVHFTNSPEEQFPRGLNDCINAIRWFTSEENRKRFNILPNKGVALHGESGGGNLVIASAMSLKNTNLVSCIYANCPWIYGLPDIFDEENKHINRSMFENLFVTEETFQGLKNTQLAMGLLYTPQGSENQRNPLAWPSLATEDDVRGMPPTMITNEECDAIVDQGEHFYRLLQRADVPSWRWTHNGMMHNHMGDELTMTLEMNAVKEFVLFHTRETPQQLVPEN